MSKDSSAAWRAAHVEERRVYAAAYRGRHRAERREYQAAWRAAHLKRDQAYQAAYRANDPWRVARAAFGKARRSAVVTYGLDPGTLTKEIFARLHLLPCAYCGLMPAMGVDHVMPMGRGGANSIDNLVPSCLPCNHRKNRYEPVAYT